MDYSQGFGPSFLWSFTPCMMEGSKKLEFLHPALLEMYVSMGTFLAEFKNSSSGKKKRTIVRGFDRN